MKYLQAQYNMMTGLRPCRRFTKKVGCKRVEGCIFRHDARWVDGPERRCGAAGAPGEVATVAMPLLLRSGGGNAGQPRVLVKRTKTWYGRL